MKTKRKALVAVLCAVAIAATTFVATVAWLSDTEKVTNTFTVGKVDIKVDEAKVDEKGVPVPNADRVIENDYHLMPGQTYVKDPTMTVLKGSDESYVRMIVTFNKGAELEAIFGDPFLPQNFVDGWNNTKWVTTGVITEEGDTLSYEFRYATKVNATGSADTELEPLFTSFTFPSYITNEQIATLEGLKIEVEGHAMQVAGFESDVNAAWAAFDAQLAAANP